MVAPSPNGIRVYASRRLAILTENFAQGRLMVFGGAGYDARNIAAAWTGVLRELIRSEG